MQISGLTSDPVARLEIGVDEKILLVASTGGHLEQLFLWSERLELNPDHIRWVTFRNEQSESLLEEKRVNYVEYVRPRDLGAVARAARDLTSIAKREKVTTVISTGAAVAVSAAITSALLSIKMIYIESLARFTDLSLTGKIIGKFPHVKRYVQVPHLARGGYEYLGSILDEFERYESQTHLDDVSRVLVTVGTIQPYGFDRLIRTLDPLLRPYHVTWQIGSFTSAPSHGTVFDKMSRRQLFQEAEAADVVITHAGVGSILMALDVGKYPIVVAREQRYHEHVDDHQMEIVRGLSPLGLVHNKPLTLLSENDLRHAAAYCIRPRVRTSEVL